jgi:TonB system transport protein ExbD (group 1)
MGAKVADSGGGGKGKRSSYPENSEINVVPFVDIMLVLLIIFMVAAPLATVNVAVDLPPPNLEPPPPNPKEPIFISMQNDGAIYLGDNPIPLGSLIGAVVQRTKGDRDNRIMVRADRNVIYGSVMNVMNLLQEYGYTKVALIAEEV